MHNRLKSTVLLQENFADWRFFVVCGNKFLRFEMTEISPGKKILRLFSGSSRTFKWEKPQYLTFIVRYLESQFTLLTYWRHINVIPHSPRELCLTHRFICDTDYRVYLGSGFFFGNGKSCLCSCLSPMYIAPVTQVIKSGLYNLTEGRLISRTIA